MSDVYISMQNLASDFSMRKIPLDNFRVEFAGLYFRARQAKHDQQANALAGKIMGPLSEFARGDRSEDCLRDAVAEATGAAIRV